MGAGKLGTKAWSDAWTEKDTKCVVDMCKNCGLKVSEKDIEILVEGSKKKCRMLSRKEKEWLCGAGADGVKRADKYRYVFKEGRI